MSSTPKNAGCQCDCAPPPARPARWQARRLARAVPPALLSIGIAFFPKCPLCWAAYASVLGSIGVARLPPYQPWMLPLLVGLLLVHLYLLRRQLAAHRYWPFVCSLGGAACVLLGRLVVPQQSGLAVAGIGLLVLGSLLNSFATSSVSSLTKTPTPA